MALTAAGLSYVLDGYNGVRDFEEALAHKGELLEEVKSSVENVKRWVE